MQRAAALRADGRPPGWQGAQVQLLEVQALELCVLQLRVQHQTVDGARRLIERLEDRARAALVRALDAPCAGGKVQQWPRWSSRPRLSTTSCNRPPPAPHCCRRLTEQGGRYVERLCRQGRVRVRLGPHPPAKPGADPQRGSGRRAQGQTGSRRRVQQTAPERRGSCCAPQQWRVDVVGAGQQVAVGACRHAGKQRLALLVPQPWKSRRRHGEARGLLTGPSASQRGGTFDLCTDGRRAALTWPVDAVQHHVHTPVWPVVCLLAHQRQQLCAARAPAHMQSWRVQPCSACSRG